MKPDRIWCGRSCQRAAGSMRAVMAASCQKKTKTPKTDSWHTAAPRGRRERRGSPWRGDCGIARPDQSTCSWRVVGTRYSRGTWLRRQPRERGAAQDLVIFWLFLDIWFLAFLPNAECEAPRRQSAAPHDAGRATRDAASAASSSSLHCASPASAAGVPNGVGVVSERCRLEHSTRHASASAAGGAACADRPARPGRALDRSGGRIGEHHLPHSIGEDVARVTTHVLS
jgi:hypothetical protein